MSTLQFVAAQLATLVHWADYDGQDEAVSVLESALQNIEGLLADEAYDEAKRHLQISRDLHNQLRREAAE